MHTRPPIDSVLAIVHKAGLLVKTMQPHVSMSIKQDGSVVTEADISSHNLLLKELGTLTAGIPIVSEEQSDDKNQKIIQGESAYWVIDPLDVTANYAVGGNNYSVNIALVENGIPVLGVLFFPSLEEIYYTGDDAQAYKQIAKEPPEAIHVASVQTKTRTVAVRPDTDVADKTLKVIFTRGQRRACLVASGEATFCSEQKGFRIWDSAATYAIVHAAGGILQKHDSSELRYNESLELPAYFVGHPHVLQYLRADTSDSNVTYQKNS